MAPELAGKKTAKAAAAAVKPATRAYVTFLAGDSDYWKGVVGLAKGLRKVGSAYPLVVAVLPDVPEAHRRILVSQGCIVREIEPVYPPVYNVINYSKLRIWEFVEYERMVYLDADIQVFENIDELFELDKGNFYAVMDCFCEKAWSHTPQYKIGYCQQCLDKVAWPTAELGPPPALYFNAGMFVHEPSMVTAKALLDTLHVTPPSPFAEQDFLNMFFTEQYNPIPPVYNLPPAMLLRHPENVQLEEVKVVRLWPAKEAYMQEFIKGLISPPPADASQVGKKFQPFGNWLAEAKGVIFTAGKNLPAVATLAASSAAAGVVAAAASPAMCFAFYAVFIAAMAVVTISLRRA